MGDIFFQDYLTLYQAILRSRIVSSILLGLSYAIAVQTPDPEKTSAYECGFEPFEDARNRFDVRFYIVAILFLIFDIEVVYLFPWAGVMGTVSVRAFFVVLLFLIILRVGFIYEVAKGALNLQ